MSLIDELDKRLVTIGEIADLLEAQMGRCERGRMPLATWVTSPDELEKAARNLPRLPPELSMDYAA